MTTTDKRKRSLYFPDTILREMQTEAKRQERSLSWIVQYAWRLARTELMRLPSVGDSGFHEEELDQLNDEEASASHDEHRHHEENTRYTQPNSHFSTHGS